MKITHPKNKIIGLALMIIVIGFFIFLIKSNLQLNAQIMEIKKDWNVYVNGALAEQQPNDTLIEYVLPNINKGDHLDLVHHLYDFNLDNPGIVFDTWHTITEVYVDDKLIYSWGQELAKKDKMLGGKRHRVNLPSNYKGKELRIRLIANEGNSMDEFESIAVSSFENEHDFWFNRSLLVIFFGATFYIVGLLILIFSYLIMCKTDKFISSTMLGMSFQVMGVYFLSRSKIMSLLIENPQIYNQIEFLTLYSLPICLLVYSFNIGDTPKSKTLKRAYNIFIIVYLLGITSAILLNNFTHIHYSSFLMFFYIFSLIAYIIIYKAIKIEENKNIGVRLTMIAVTAFVLGSALSLIVFYSKGVPALNKTFMLWRYYDFILLGSTVTMLVLFFIGFYMTITQGILLKLDNEKLYYLAHNDSMTLLQNRRAFDKKINELSQIKDRLKYGIIVIDINNLKITNDTLGHHIGDEMIEGIGQILNTIQKQKSFENNVVPYRTGGDEFVIICYNLRHLENIEQMFNKLVKEHNEQVPDFTISTSLGKATTDDANSPEKIFELADKRMYIQKQRFKRTMEQSGAAQDIQNI